MGKPAKAGAGAAAPADAPAAGGRKRAAPGGLSLDLPGLLGGAAGGGGGAKKARASGGGGGALQAKGRAGGDSSGSAAPTIEALQLRTESLFRELAAQAERSHAAFVSRLAEREAAVHKQAKADHAKTCQVLQDSQGAIELATKQHAQVLKQVMATSKATVAAVQSVAKACNGTVRESVTAFNRDLAALRAKAGIKG